MQNAIYTEESENFTLSVVPDSDPANPRTEWDNLGTIIYRKGARTPIGEVEYDDQERAAFARRRDVIKLPVYFYNHSGLTINTTGFSCPWDSGQSGWIFVGYEKIRKEYGVKRITEKVKEKIKNLLRAEVETYDQYLRGEVYGYIVEKDDVQIDCCWGFYGEKYAIEEGRNALKACLPKEIQLQLFDDGRG